MQKVTTRRKQFNDPHHRDFVPLRPADFQLDACGFSFCMETLTLEELKKLRQNPDHASRKIGWVYILFLGETPVYVGTTRDIVGRIRRHKLDKNFDSFVQVECAAENMLATEKAYILSLGTYKNLNWPVKGKEVIP